METKKIEGSYFNNAVNIFWTIAYNIIITTLSQRFGRNADLCEKINPKTTKTDGLKEDCCRPCATNEIAKSKTTTTQSTNTVPKEPQTEEKKSVTKSQLLWTDQIRKINSQNNSGSRIMIIMRGLPGSGKTHLARLIVKTLIGPSFTDYKSHVFSTDDYFMVNGKYVYNKTDLSHAHSSNQRNVRDAAIRGLSPIIIDNTNVNLWEMRPYVLEAVRNGYIVEVVEPTTPWSKTPKELFNKNSHGVPLGNIKRMLANYVPNVTGESMINAYGFSYSEDMIPPTKRLIPAIPKEYSNQSEETKVDEATVHFFRSQANEYAYRSNHLKLLAESRRQRGLTKEAEMYLAEADKFRHQFELARSKAAVALIQYHSKAHKDMRKLDLHFFYKKEAVEVMDVFIDTHIQRLRDIQEEEILVFFITGRGLHSPGPPKLKPACRNRLSQRGLHFSECNPGMFSCLLKYDSKLTYQLKTGL